jgi:serine protease inhibitor
LKLINLQVQLPKFRIESTHGELVEQLKALGITDLFDRGQADLSGMVTEQTPVWVDKVVQKAFIVVCGEKIKKNRNK